MCIPMHLRHNHNITETVDRLYIEVTIIIIIMCDHQLQMMISISFITHHTLAVAHCTIQSTIITIILILIILCTCLMYHEFLT